MRAILTYHSIDSSGSPISLSRATLERHARWLAASDVLVVPLQELLAVRDEDDAVAITFDDGFANFGTDAWPVLRDHGLPATVFVVSELAGKTNAWEDVPRGKMPLLPLLDWDGVAKVAEEGATIGVHGRTHERLVGLPGDRLQEEVLGARIDVEARTGKPATTFAYPYGDRDRAAVAAVAETFDCAVTADLGWVRREDNHHELPRLDAYYLRTAGMLERFGSPMFAGYVKLRGAARAVRRMFVR